MAMGYSVDMCCVRAFDSLTLHDNSRKLVRKNYVQFVQKLRHQEYICNIFINNNIMTEEHKEGILGKSTTAERNRELILFLLRHLDRAFSTFCDVLEQTNQLDLLKETALVC